MKTTSEILEELLNQYANYRGLQITAASENTVNVQQISKRSVNTFWPISPSREGQLKRLKELQMNLAEIEREISRGTEEFTFTDNMDNDSLKILELRMKYNSVVAQARHLLEDISGESVKEKPRKTSRLSQLASEALDDLKVKTEINDYTTNFVLKSDNVLEQTTDESEYKDDLLKEPTTNSAYFPQPDRDLIPAFEQQRVDRIQQPLISLEVEKYEKRAETEIKEEDENLKTKIKGFFKGIKESLFGKSKEDAFVVDYKY